MSVQKEADLAVTRVVLPAVFTPHAPVASRELFAGRLSQIELLIGAVSQVGQHAILFGERGVGKTSLARLIESFWNARARDDELVVCRVNCDTTDDFDSICIKIVDEVQLAYEIKGWKFPPNEIIEQIVDNLKLNSATPNTLRRLFTLAAKDFVIILDEFDRVHDEDSRVLMADTIKTLSDQLVSTTMVIVGVADDVNQLISSHASIDRNLVQVLMPRMSNTNPV